MGLRNIVRPIDQDSNIKATTEPGKFKKYSM